MRVCFLLFTSCVCVVIWVLQLVNYYCLMLLWFQMFPRNKNKKTFVPKWFWTLNSLSVHFRCREDRDRTAVCVLSLRWCLLCRHFHWNEVPSSRSPPSSTWRSVCRFTAAEMAVVGGSRGSWQQDHVLALARPVLVGALQPHGCVLAHSGQQRLQNTRSTRHLNYCLKPKPKPAHLGTKTQCRGSTGTKLNDVFPFSAVAFLS